ncbi:PREDICTED: thyrotropin releasing hormone [Crocodylus porosus]|uniref:thyrotropin releasing hormone n=1 Tax=Crocodylus porosus TaxID=8502 RepID=UPI00093DEBD2|nr:PREDICTED: thyrotropin releasing hormone [Crocodylus porosus]
MTPVQLLLLLSLTLSGICLNLGQLTLEGGENSERSHLDDILQRAESILLRSILKKVEEEEELNKEPDASEPDSLSKRQHPGKRFFNELEKRQHPGKREDGEEALYGDIQKRQHPGKREEDDDLDRYLELQKRQHPGKRSLWDQYVDAPSTQLTYLNELSKRQHPGKRYLVYAKRQHPGKRGWEDELDLGEQDLEKRQHPGKRFSDSESPDYAAPCDLQDDINCSKGSLLLELLDNVNKGREEEKRQHPGRRFAWESEAEAEE